MGAGGGGDHHIGLVQHRVAAAVGNVGGVVVVLDDAFHRIGAAVADADLLEGQLFAVLIEELADLAETDDEHGFIFKSSHLLFQIFQSDIPGGQGDLRYFQLAFDLFGGFDGLLKETVEDFGSVVELMGEFVGLFDLTQNFIFAHYGGFQTRGYPKNMLDGFLIVVTVDVFFGIFQPEIVDVGIHDLIADGVVFPAVEEIDFTAVAGGKDHRFFHAEVEKAGGELDLLGFAESDFFPDLRAVLVVNAENGNIDLHDQSPSLRCFDAAVRKFLANAGLA